MRGSAGGAAAADAARARSDFSSNTPSPSPRAGSTNTLDPETGKTTNEKKAEGGASRGSAGGAAAADAARARSRPPRAFLPVPPAGGWRLGIRDPDAVGAASTAARTVDSLARHAEKERERYGRIAALMAAIKARGAVPLSGGEKVLKGQLARAP